MLITPLLANLTLAAPRSSAPFYGQFAAVRVLSSPPSGCCPGITGLQWYRPWASSPADLTATAAHPARTSRTVSEPGGRMRPSAPHPSASAAQVVRTEPPPLPALQELPLSVPR